MIVMIPLDEDKVSVCQIFARAPFFLKCDTETGTKECIKNIAADEQGGAGVRAAQQIADEGCDALITVRCGENAAKVFQYAGIAIYKAADGSAADQLTFLADGQLEILTHFHAGYHGIR